MKDILKEEEPSIHTRMTKEDVLLAKDGLLERTVFVPPDFLLTFTSPVFPEKTTHTTKIIKGLPKQQKMPEILFGFFHKGNFNLANMQV